MPRGEKSRYTDKQKRTAQHIEQSYIDKGISEDEAEARAWATVNKQDGGGKKSGSGRGKSAARDTSRHHETDHAALHSRTSGDPAKKSSHTRKTQES